MDERLLWTGEGESTPELVDFLDKGRPRWLYWFEPTLDGGELDLLLTPHLSKALPLRVVPNQWLHFDGRIYRPGAREWGVRGVSDPA